MSILTDAATDAVEFVSNTVSDIGNVTGLSGVVDSFSEMLSSVGLKFTKVPELNLPLPNPLHSYATYDYVLSLAPLTKEQLNNPDDSYIKGASLDNLICKSANADPYNRIKTIFGSFDFFIENLSFMTQIGYVDGSNTNTAKLTFEITEPYSMGLFPIACQQAAWDSHYDNWRSAPFLLKIEFRGNKEDGALVNIQNSTRYIPFNFSTISSKIKETGTVYVCEGVPTNTKAYTEQYGNFKSDVSVNGVTVQEVLQTGEKSLQAVLNQRNKQLKKDGLVEVADEIVILFPEEVSSDPSKADAAAPASGNAATHAVEKTDGNVVAKLGVSRSDINDTLVQSVDSCNFIGKAKMGFDETKKGDAPFPKDNAVWDEKRQLYVRGNNNVDQSNSDMRFRQNTDIVNAINQVILQSAYPTEALKTENMTEEGYRKWWRVDVQVYDLSDKEQKNTGEKARVVVYRILPANHHVSAMAPANVKAPGINSLLKQTVKHYEYLYTGKNVDVLRFDIDFSASFAYVLEADAGKNNQDVKTQEKTGGAASDGKSSIFLLPGKIIDMTLGVIPTIVKYISVGSKSESQGGGGIQGAANRAARNFHDAITREGDMMALNMEILGDPYFIAHSGLGNYTSRPTQYTNINEDGSVNYQNGEVHIVVKFRTPIDINQTTGLYSFENQTKTSPVMSWSGLYRVTIVTNNFKQGKFTQTIQGYRIPLQESDVESTPNELFNLGNVIKQGEEGLAHGLKNINGFLQDVADDPLNSIGNAAGELTKDVTSFVSDKFK